MVTKCCCGGLDLPLPECSRDLVPDLQVRLDQRTSVDCPAMESDGSLCRDKTSRLHLLGPQPVMRSDNKLRVGEIRLQEFAELIAVSGVHRHNHVVQKRKIESISEEPLHEREIKADAHTVLMALAMVSTGRKQTAFVEVDIEIELAFARGELRGELGLIVFVDRPIERAEVFLHVFIECVQLILHDAAVG